MFPIGGSDIGAIFFNVYPTYTKSNEQIELTIVSEIHVLNGPSWRHATKAQEVEQRTGNPYDWGSSPRRGCFWVQRFTTGFYFTKYKYYPKTNQ